MTPQTITRSPVAPQTLLCRCFCRHFAALTGTGLAASAGTASRADQEEQADD